jgi:hypothetical protein
MTLPLRRETKKAAKVPSHRRQNPCWGGVHYARLVNSVRVSVRNRVYSMPRMLTCLLILMAFSSRVRVYHAWQNADADGSPLVKHAHEGNRAQGKVAAEKGDRL